MKSDNLTGASHWQIVFSQSKVNGAHYDGEELQIFPWHWPTDTFLQRRRRLLKNSRPEDRSVTHASDNDFYESICTDYVRSGNDTRYYKEGAS